MATNQQYYSMNMSPLSTPRIPSPLVIKQCLYHHETSEQQQSIESPLMSSGKRTLPSFLVCYEELPPSSDEETFRPLNNKVNFLGIPYQKTSDLYPTMKDSVNDDYLEFSFPVVKKK